MTIYWFVVETILTFKIYSVPDYQFSFKENLLYSIWKAIYDAFLKKSVKFPALKLVTVEVVSTAVKEGKSCAIGSKPA